VFFVLIISWLNSVTIYNHDRSLSSRYFSDQSSVRNGDAGKSALSEISQMVLLTITAGKLFTIVNANTRAVNTDSTVMVLFD